MSPKKRKRREILSLQPPQHVPPTMQPDKTWNEFFREGLSVGSMVFGVSLMTGGWFKTGVFFFYFGAAWLAYDTSRQKFFRSLRRPRRQMLFLSYVVALAVFSWLYLFLPASLEIHPASTLVHYGAGSNIGGIPWQENFSRIDLTIENTTDYDYDDFDALVSTDLAIAGFKQIGGFAICAMDTEELPPMPTLQHFENLQPVGPANMALGQGEGDVYRLRCDKIPSHTKTAYVIATIHRNPKAFDLKTIAVGDPVYLEPEAARWLKLDVRFKLSGSSRHLTFARCNTGQVCNITRRIDVGDFGLKTRRMQQYVEFRDYGPGQQPSPP